MNKKIDCFLIGHNEMDFAEYEKSVRMMGEKSGAYQDLYLNFLWIDNKPYHAVDIFNLSCHHGDPPKDNMPPLTMGETFSAAIAYLGTYLNKHGLTFDYVNSFQDEKKELAGKLEQENIVSIAIITTLYVSALPIMEIINFLRKHNRTAKIIIGGPFVSTQIRTHDPMVTDYLFKSIDSDFYVNSSQGEAALVKIINALKNGSNLEKIDNIYFKSEGKYVAAGVTEENNRLSENTVKWDLFADKIGTYLNVRTSISCPFSCAFCGFPQHAGKFQTVPPGQVEEELNAIDKIKRIKSINFIDDTFNVPKERYKEILRIMIKNKYHFKWHSHFRCQYADRETIELMKESGCEGVFLGIESGSDQILKNMNKATTVKEYLKGITLLKEFDIPVFGSFIVGFPGETHQTVNDTIQFIKESRLDFFRASLWYAEPITPIWKEKEKYGIKGSHFEWSHKTMDSQTAYALIKEIFLGIENPIWIPQYNFDFFEIFQLINRGMGIDEVKRFLNTFNLGIKEKLAKPFQQNCSDEIIRQLNNACRLKENIN
jgi:radical SAM PhpK family P-methyltransferase